MRPSSSHPFLRRARRAFTLMEILVALAILGLLVGLAVTKLDVIFGGAQISTAELFVKDTMKTALTAYRISSGSFPTTAESLQVLVTAPAGKEGSWRGPFVEKIPADPWGEPYQYAFPGKRNKGGYDLWSKGPDKQDGTDDDIGNWESASTVAVAPK